MAKYAHIAVKEKVMEQLIILKSITEKQTGKLSWTDFLIKSFNIQLPPPLPVEPIGEIDSVIKVIKSPSEVSNTAL